MAEILLAPTTFAPAQARRQEHCHTIIEDAPQISIRRAAPPLPPAKAAITSPMSDDFPTPKAALNTASTMMTLCFPIETPSSPSSSDSRSQSDGSSIWSKRSSNTSFDSMYDISSSEGEDVKIKLSSSVKKRVAHIRRHPSISIPSPSQWPTAHKARTATPVSPSMTLQLSPAILQRLDMQALNLPAMSKTPSLAGSSTSGELTTSSCPSTPDIQTQTEDAWDAPIQLDPSAFSMLQQLSGQHEPEEAVVEIPLEVSLEMREIAESPKRFGGLQLQTNALTSSPRIADELSALSIPSPSNFFSSLSSAVARRAWSGNDAPTTTVATEFYGVPFKADDCPAPLPTSTAAAFYGVPWKTRPENPIEHTITIAETLLDDQDPDTARRIVPSPVQEVDEIDEHYHVALEANAAANLDRTQLWLSSQKTYLDTALGDDSLAASFKDLDGASPKTPDQTTAPECAISPNSKKSVRFVDAVNVEETVKTEEKKKRISPIHDGTFWEAFCHTKRSQRARDVFQHRQMRAEAEQVRRNSASTGHAGQLKGLFEIAAVDRPTTSRPVSGFVNDGPEDEEKKAAISRAERERQALEQMQPSTWHVEAQKELNGGTLLTSPIVATFKQRQDVQILDLSGQAHCSWAWDVAVTHPRATVYTTVATEVEAYLAESSMDGPQNHCVVAAPKLWELPFEDNTFNVVSARNLYMHLRTQVPHGEMCDEWELTLQECMRVLKPGGYFEFDLLDAEMMHPEPAAQALGVEFAFNLKTRGYDPSSGKNFLPRLKRAGFKNIKRAWMILPLANAAPQWTDAGKMGFRIATPSSSASSRFDGGLDTPEGYGPPLTGSTADVRAITGLVGARSWEQWMLKINAELGRSETRCLEGVGKALEESGKANAGWRCLVGWAQKGA